MTFAPLDGVLVVSLEQAVAAPFCSSRLADAGARVIKVERAEGDFARAYDSAVEGLSAYFVWLNRGKESVIVDIKNADDNAMLHRMISQADVFIQNLAPGAAGRAGLDSAELRAKNPRLITCDISGYGEDGPYRDMKAYDFLIQCETGLAAITGGPEEPSRVGVSLCDIAAGMYAVQGITQALLQREKTGQGTGLQVSLFDALSDWMSVPVASPRTHRQTARPGRPQPSRGSRPTAPTTQKTIARSSSRSKTSANGTTCALRFWTTPTLPPSPHSPPTSTASPTVRSSMKSSTPSSANTRAKKSRQN